MLSDARTLEEKSEEDHVWNLLSSVEPVSSSAAGDETTTVSRAGGHRRRYRSKSAVSTDPRSPYYTSPGLNEDSVKIAGGRFTKAPSVSCVPGYDGHRYAEVANKSRLKFKGGIPGLNLALDDPKAATIRQHYYPEGGWGHVVCFCAVLIEFLVGGLLYSFGMLLVIILHLFRKESSVWYAVCVGASSMCFSQLMSPVIVALSRKKSVRLMAILGGLVTALGCLFTSFASQMHQLFFSFGIFIGGGACLTRDTSTVIVGQYFKRRREFVEIFVISGTGLGLAFMPVTVTQLVRSFGWRLGLQAVTGILSLTFIIGIFYRPASLYHPQRRAILHLKGLQKRSKAKDKNAAKEKPPFFDFGVLKSKTVQILISGSAVSAFGVNAPIMLLMHQGKKEGMDYNSLLLLQSFLGVASTLGTAAFGFIVVRNSMQCMIARQYLSQASCFVMALSLLAFTCLKDYYGYLIFVWVYGFFYGGYQYSLKMFAFEKVRARNFTKAWGYLQCGQAIPHAVGLPLTGYLNERFGSKRGFYFSSACLFAGSLFLFLIDVHKRNVKRQKDSRRSAANNEQTPEENAENQQRTNYSGGSRRSSLQELPANEYEHFSKQRTRSLGNFVSEVHRQELTCISEEVAIENFMEDFIDDCITSCNKEEKYLMLSEFENNVNSQESGSRSCQEIKRLPPLRKMSTVTPPTFEQCPQCLRVVSADGCTESNNVIQITKQNSKDGIEDGGVNTTTML